jgi:putative transport protein
VEASLGIQRKKLGVSSAWQPIGFRAYAVPQNARIIGKTIAEAEKSVPGARFFVERLRRRGEIFSPVLTTVVEVGDTLAVIGRTDILVTALGASSSEVADSELLEIPVATFDLYVTSKAIAGKTLQEIADGVPEARGVLLRRITRGEQSLPIGTGTVVEQGDTLQVVGSEAAVDKLALIVGIKVEPTEESDLAVLGIAVFVGILVGGILTIPVGNLRITLGTSVGTLLAGVVVGWMRSVKPWLGRMPDAAVLFMKSIGLAAFVAMIGLKAGPIFVHAVKEYGVVLLLGGIVVTLTPLIAGLLFGRYVLHLNAALLVGGIAGAQTMIAGVAAVQEKSGSSVSTLGYSYTVAFGHILLTTWGTVIVALLS